MNAHQLRNIYDRGYFHGVNSGYPSEGYAASHPSWVHWIEYVKNVRPHAATWLDIGCAYGYLVEEVQAQGIRSFGIDVSPFALRQNEAMRPFLAEGLAEALPFADHSFDIVSLFDVIEHFRDPQLVVREVSRLLKPGGLCLGSTPDPLFFKKHEETHASEHPPSFWVDLFLRCGLDMAFRFAGEPFNMEFAAVRLDANRESAADDPAFQAFQHDQLRFGSEVIEIPEKLRACLRIAYRLGWDTFGAETENARFARGPEASIYLLNTSREPLRLRLQVTVPLSGIYGSARVQLDDRPLGVLHLENVDQTREFPIEPFLLSSGGHHLRFIFQDGLQRLPFLRIELLGEAVPIQELITSFPFDLYQRYAAVQEVLKVIYSDQENGLPRVRVLDVGGVMGGKEGHMGSLSDFLPGWDVTISDVRLCDVPKFILAPPDSLPAVPQRHDIVVCLDVFEHVRPEQRTLFLDTLLDMPRQWLILGCPCANPAIIEAEEVLDEFIRYKTGYRHQFIAEHRQFGLPVQEAIEQKLREKKLDFLSMPNGCLHRWLFMQCLTFFLSTFHSSQLLERINRYYNLNLYRHDRRDPAYRKIFVIDVGGSGLLRQVDRTQLVPSETINLSEDLSSQVSVLLQLTTLQELEDENKKIDQLSFLLGEREKYIEDLIRHIRNLEALERARHPQIENLERENADLHQHARNLEAERNDLSQHALNLERERNSLQSHLLSSNTAVIERDHLLTELRQAVTVLEAEKIELLRRTNESQIDRIDIQKRALDLETENVGQRNQIRRLQDIIAAMRDKEAQLQGRISQLETEYQRRNQMLSRGEMRDLVPLIREYFKRSMR